MVDVLNDREQIVPQGTASARRRRVALILILIVDVGYIAWGAGAAATPDHLLGPGGKAILPAGYEGYSGGSWSDLAGVPTSYMSSQSWYDNTIVVSPSNANVVIAGGTPYTRSTSAGASWAAPPWTGVHVDVHDLRYQGATPGAIW